MERTFQLITSRGVACAYLLATTILWIPDAYGSSAEEQLRQAQDAFLFGDFSAAASGVISLVDQTGLSAALRREANLLAAQCYLELGDDAAVEAAICATHDADPLWQPSSDVLTEREVLRFSTALKGCPDAPRATGPVIEGPPASSPGIPVGSSVDATSSVRVDPAAVDPLGSSDEPGSRPWFRKPVTWIVGGAAAAVGIVLAMGGGGADDPATPTGIGDFPAAPED